MISLLFFLVCLLGIKLSTLSGFQLASVRNSNRRNGPNRLSPMKMGIDVSGLKLAPVSEGFIDAAVGSSDIWTDASNALIIVGGLAYFAYEKRPRGSARDDLIEMRKSTVPNANFGAFSKKFIPKGTVVGRYPGFLRTMADALASKENADAGRAAQSYFFSVDDDQVLDPTNKQGELEASIRFLGVYSADTLIARINEPPLGGDVNLCTEIEKNGVTVTAERDIFPDEELFMDYGSDYDRSNYKMPEPAASMKTQESLQETEKKNVKVEPIVAVKVEDKKAEEKVEEKKVERKVSAAVPPPISTVSASMFDSLIGNKMNTDEDFLEDRKNQNQAFLIGGDESFEDKKGEITDAPQYRPALSVKESEQLLESLDDMTDAEVAAVLAKLQAAVSERIKSEVSDALFSKSLESAGKSITKDGNKDPVESKKMPRAPPVDPEMRKKYKKELDAIENELDKIYSDPLGVWQEFMKNPEKFLKESEMKLAEDEDLQ